MVQIIKRGSERAPAVSYALAVIRRSQTVYARSMAFFAVLHDVQALEDVDGSCAKEEIPARSVRPLYASRASPRRGQLTSATVTATASPALPRSPLGDASRPRPGPRTTDVCFPRIGSSIQGKCHITMCVSPHRQIPRTAPRPFQVLAVSQRSPISHCSSYGTFPSQDVSRLPSAQRGDHKEHGYDPAWQLRPDQRSLVGPGAPSPSIAGLMHANRLQAVVPAALYLSYFHSMTWRTEALVSRTSS